MSKKYLISNENQKEEEKENINEIKEYVDDEEKSEKPKKNLHHY